MNIHLNMVFGASWTFIEKECLFLKLTQIDFSRICKLVFFFLKAFKRVPFYNNFSLLPFSFAVFKAE